MPTTPLRIERTDTIDLWTLDLPETRNPISGDDMIDAIVEAADRVNRDATVRAVILTGAGRAFSSGGNVKDMADGAGLFGHPPAAQRTAYRDGIQRIPRALHACEVPLIAAVNGPAVGAGCDLAMMCDLRIASTDAWFAESFVKLGIIPGDGGAFFLPRAVGAARAAETALAWGLVSRVVEPGQLLTEARALAGRVAANPPHAVRMAKKLLREAHGRSLDGVLELSAAGQAIAHQTKDHHEAVAAMIERREPKFEGN